MNALIAEWRWLNLLSNPGVRWGVCKQALNGDMFGRECTGISPRDHMDLRLVKQCKPLQLGRCGLYYVAVGANPHCFGWSLCTSQFLAVDVAAAQLRVISRYRTGYITRFTSSQRRDAVHASF